MLKEPLATGHVGNPNILRCTVYDIPVFVEEGLCFLEQKIWAHRAQACHLRQILVSSFTVHGPQLSGPFSSLIRQK